MNSVKLKDIKATCKSQLCVYTLTMSYWRKIEKTMPCVKASKNNKMLRNKFNQGVEISVHWKLGHFSERNWRTHKWMENIPYL